MYESLTDIVRVHVLPVGAQLGVLHTALAHSKKVTQESFPQDFLRTSQADQSATILVLLLSFERLTTEKLCVTLVSAAQNIRFCPVLPCSLSSLGCRKITVLVWDHYTNGKGREVLLAGPAIHSRD